MALSRIMCFGNANKEDGDAKKSREIEKQIREDQKRLAKEVKLLLLGRRTRYGSHAGLTVHHRCWRVWQVHNIKADALDTQQGLLELRTTTMEGHDI